MDNKFKYLIDQENFFNGKINEVSINVINTDFESDPIYYKIDIKNKNDQSAYFTINNDLNILYM